MKQAVQLAAKGFCMGAADVIPGVSGGTMALVLGIYRRLIHSIRLMDLTLLMALLKGDFYRRLLARLKAPTAPFSEDDMSLRADAAAFLVVLVVGIASAILTGAKLIPALMASYPEPMRGFFFGLILISILAPLRMMREKRLAHLPILLVFLVVTYWIVGLHLDASGFAETEIVFTAQEAPTNDVTLDASMRVAPDGLEKLGKHNLAFTPTSVSTWPAGETSHRLKVTSIRTGIDGNLDSHSLKALWGQTHERGGSKIVWKPISESAPEGTWWNTVQLTQGEDATGGSNPALWYLFVCGAIAICAMILPGLSGAFLLLLLGQYDYILDSLSHLISGDLNAAPIVLVFLAGITVGILTFSRFLHWLLDRAHDATMIALVGLMIGSLRRLWPFQQQVGLGHENILPATFSSITGWTLLAMVVGMALVGGFLFMDARIRSDQPESP
jgi:uncharacterized membrane protein